MRSEGDLAPDELAALDIVLPFLRELERTVTRSFKMVTLDVLLEADQLVRGMPLYELAQRAHATLHRSPELWAHVTRPERFASLSAETERAWLAYWKENPISAWTTPKKDRRTWFRLQGDRFELDLAIPEPLVEPFERLTRELVDYRLAQYRRRKQPEASEGFVSQLTWNQRDPILKLPSRKAHTLPEGETDVRLPDGSIWQFRFMKEFINVARMPGAPRNQLPDLLRRCSARARASPGLRSRCASTAARMDCGSSR